MTKSELYKKGDAMRRSMYGEEAYNKANETVYSDPIMRKFLDVATETQFWGSMDTSRIGYKNPSLNLCSL